MFLPIVPSLQHSGIYGALPSMWVGVDAPSGTGYFARVGLGSTYIRKVSATDIRTYTKVSSTGAAADWVVDGGGNQGKGFIAVDLAALRELGASNAFINAAGNGGLLALDTTPTLTTVGASDNEWRVQWAAANVDVLSFQVTMPPDFDPAGAVKLYMRSNMGGATNTPKFTSDVYWNEAFTKKTYLSDSLSATVTDRLTTLLAADIPAAARTLSVAFAPAAHAADAVNLYAVWLEYVRK